MVSLRGLQSTSSVTEAGSSTSFNASTTSALTSATESTSSTGTTLTTTMVPTSSSRSVTTRKETTSSGEEFTTVTTTTTTVSTSTSNASSSTASSTSNTASSTSNTTASGTTSTATEGNTGSVSTATITTTEGENGASPVTTVTTDNGVNMTSTSTTKDATTGITTVTTTTKSDTDMNGSASSSTTWATTSSGSSGVASVSESTTTQTSSAAGSLVSTSATTTSSSAGVTIEGASSSTTSSTQTNTGSSTSTSTSTESNKDSITTGAATNEATGTITTNGDANSATASSATSSTTTSSTNGATTNTTSSGEISTTTITSSTGSKDMFTVSADASQTTETSGSSTATSSKGSISSDKTSTAGSSSSVTSSSSSSSTSSSTSLVSWFTSSFRDEETQLVVGSNSSTTAAGASRQVCNGLPALVTRSSTETPNGGCPDELTSLNASCTCLTGYSETASSWYFHITTESWNSTTSTTTRSLTQSPSDELAINTIRPIWVSSSLETLVIEGAGNTPAEIEFVDENRVASGSSLNLVRSASNSSNVSTLFLSNLDLSSVAEKNSDFVPATVTNLTLRNCNISMLSASFTRDWSWLQYLDLSSNNIDTEYIGGADLKELNLSHNALAVFPTGSLNSSGLQALYIQGNAITDFNVSQEQFEQIQGLTTFTADQPESSSTCQDGAWQSAHDTTFCVLGASTAAAHDTSQSSASSSDDDHDGLGLLAYWLIVGAIIVFFLLLLVIWQRRRHSRERESSPIVSPEAVEPTTPKYNGNDAFGDALNRDAAVAPAAVGAGSYAGYGRSHGNSVDSEDTALGASLANNQVLSACRLDYGEVTLGRCISRGGFGLVFVGSYRGRQVAVKKIRNERDVEREQVEQFVREISLISGLNHPRIVEFIGACWTTPNELSAVTELMERGDLRDVTRRFKRRGYRLTWEAHKTVIALHIAEALTYLHGLSPTVIHRDLKAKNVLLNADMEAKLSDFGIARERSFYDGSEHMTVGIGTSFWIAPEVLLGRDYDERADIYSFGVVLSEIDTDDYPYWNAQHPPQGKVQENEILRLVARGAKRPAFSDDCPPAILELAARCLRSDPDERPSASEIVVYLQQFVQDRSSSASFSSMLRRGNSFDFSTRSTNNSSPTRTAPANTIVNLQSSGPQIQQSQAMAVPSSADAAYAAGKRTKRTTTTTTTTKVASSSIGAGMTASSRPTVVEALTPAHEVVVSSPQVTHQVVRTKLPPKNKRTTKTTTTTTRHAEQGSTGGMAGGQFSTGMIVGSSDGDSSGRSFGSESVPSSRSHAGLPYGGPTSPASLRANHQAALDNLNQQRQLSSSSGEDEKKHETTAVGIDRRGQQWVVYEDVKEL